MRPRGGIKNHLPHNLRPLRSDRHRRTLLVGRMVSAQTEPGSRDIRQINARMENPLLKFTSTHCPTPDL